MLSDAATEGRLPPSLIWCEASRRSLPATARERSRRSRPRSGATRVRSRRPISSRTATFASVRWGRGSMRSRLLLASVRQGPKPSVPISRLTPGDPRTWPALRSISAKTLASGTSHWRRLLRMSPPFRRRLRSPVRAGSLPRAVACSHARHAGERRRLSASPWHLGDGERHRSRGRPARPRCFVQGHEFAAAVQLVAELVDRRPR